MEGMRTKREEQGGAGWQPLSRRWGPADGRATLAALAASGQTPSVLGRRIGACPFRVSYRRARLVGDVSLQHTSYSQAVRASARTGGF